jgi:hypothetical protein
MADEQLEAVIRYATGEVARIGDRVIDDEWPAIVVDVVASTSAMAIWGLHERGLMLSTDAAGLVFEPCSSVTWSAIDFKGRAE